MSYPTLRAATVAASLPTCPPWCDAEYCSVTVGETVHHSAPTTVETDDAVYIVALTRGDERDRPAEWDRAPLLRVTVEGFELALLSLGEASTLIGAFTAQLRQVTR